VTGGGYVDLADSFTTKCHSLTVRYVRAVSHELQVCKSLRLSGGAMRGIYLPLLIGGISPLYHHVIRLRLELATGGLNPAREMDIRGSIQKFPDWLPGAKKANGTALCH
jgi:hypothetical protein